MTKTRIYTNENFSLRVVKILRGLGHDVLTSQDAGRAGLRIPDDQVLAFATSEARVVLTFNRKHFIQLHKRGVQHTGIIICTENPRVQELAERIDAELLANPDMVNKLVRVYRPQL